MTLLQALILGMMVAYTLPMIVLAIALYKVRI